MLKSPFKYTNYGNRNESYSIERESFKLLNDIDFSNKIKEIDEDERYKYIFVLFGNNTSIDIMLAKSKVWGRDGSELSMVEWRNKWIDNLEALLDEILKLVPKYITEEQRLEYINNKTTLSGRFNNVSGSVKIPTLFKGYIDDPRYIQLMRKHGFNMNITDEFISNDDSQLPIDEPWGKNISHLIQNPKALVSAHRGPHGVNLDSKVRPYRRTIKHGYASILDGDQYEVVKPHSLLDYPISNSPYGWGGPPPPHDVEPMVKQSYDNSIDYGSSIRNKALHLHKSTNLSAQQKLAIAKLLVNRFHITDQNDIADILGQTMDMIQNYQNPYKLTRTDDVLYRFDTERNADIEEILSNDPRHSMRSLTANAAERRLQSKTKTLKKRCKKSKKRKSRKKQRKNKKK